jgi:hypothetical protein
MRFREGDKVVVAWSGMVGVVQHQDGQHVHVRLQKRRLQGPDDAGYRYASVHEDELIPHAWVRPGIGAVVGMVAIAKIVNGSWGLSRHGEEGDAHWIPPASSLVDLNFTGCGFRLDWDGIGTSEIAEVTCPDCLQMHERVYGKGVVR